MHQYSSEKYYTKLIIGKNKKSYHWIKQKVAYLKKYVKYVIVPLIGEKSGNAIGRMLCIALDVAMEIDAIEKRALWA